MPVEDLGAARESPPYGPGADEGRGGRRRPVPEVVGRRELGDDEPIGMSSLRRSGRLPQETIAIVWLVGFFLWVLMLYGSALVLRTTSLHDLEDLLRMVTHLGARHRNGQGHVATWDIDEGGDVDAWRRRPMPSQAGPVMGIRAPYWHPSRRSPCLTHP